METTQIKRPKMLKKMDQKNDEEHDSLTSLPEHLLHHILSYLTMEDVIRTSALAKRWRYIWASVPCLKFSRVKMARNKHVAFIYRSLLLYKGPKIEKLNITFRYNSTEARHVDSWIHFAVERNVNELYLDFLARFPVAYSYGLPHSLSSCRSLTVLTLKNVTIYFPIKFKLCSLKILSFDLVDFPVGAINDFLSSSPMLEYLLLTNCSWRNKLDIIIKNASLRTLKIQETSYSSSSDLEVYAPCISSFELIRSLSRKSFVFNRMQSLESVTLSCCQQQACRGLSCASDEGCSLFNLLDDLCHVKDLRLCSCYIQAVYRREEERLEFPSFDVKCLSIKTGLRKWELPGIAYMLIHSPNLESLVISIDQIEVKELNLNFEDGEYWKVQEPIFTDLLCNLKIVRIYNFMKNLSIRSDLTNTTREVRLGQLRNDTNFLRFLLRNCKVLERMTVTTSKNVNFAPGSDSRMLKQMIQIYQELLAFPRASRDAEISFS